MSDKARLKQLLLEKSYRQGTFKLSSGRESDFYIDVKQTSLDAEGALLCGKEIFKLMQQHPETIGAVGGMTLGADPLVTGASIASFLADQPVPAFIVRKEAKGHGTKQYLEGQQNLPAGCNVTLLEDVVTTGGTLLQVIDRVEEQGFKVVQIITVVDRQEGGAEVLKEKGFELEAIFTREELLA
ncbi:MAG: orotate phosphoribosyltransferase [Desulfobulbaceae bacterium]|jgi:orotate phosphoribosyltransferase|nr:orotate phosphoribosyltransferase [Desulfobulbaceae bacterium]